MAVGFANLGGLGTSFSLGPSVWFFLLLRGSSCFHLSDPRFNSTKMTQFSE